MFARRVPFVLVRLLAIVAALAGVIYSTPGRLAARTPPPVTVTGPTVIGPAGSGFGHVFAMSSTGYIYFTAMTADNTEYHMWLRTPAGAEIDLGRNGDDGAMVTNNGYVAVFNRDGNMTGSVWMPEAGWFDLAGPSYPIDGTIEPGDINSVRPLGINSAGLVLGQAASIRPTNYQQSASHLVTWSRATGAVELPDSPSSLEVRGFNESGQAAATANQEAMRWSAAEGFVSLGGVAGVNAFTRSFAISERGQIVGNGYAYQANRDFPFSWTPGTGMLELPTLLGGQGNYATSVNSRGQIGGFVRSDSQSNLKPYFLESATSAMQILPLPLNTGATGAVLNGRGQMVGQTYQTTSPYRRQGYYWSQDDGFVPLPTADASMDSDAIAITDTGVIAGSDAGHPVIWTVTPVTTGDTTPPAVSITSPVDGATLQPGQPVAAVFSCGDDTDGPDIVCAGSSPNGANVDTTPGEHRFTVTAVDKADNVTVRTVTYTVPDADPPSLSMNVHDGDVLVDSEYRRLFFRCTDPGGVEICTAIGEDGHQFHPQEAPDTSLAGDHTITLHGVDHAGNSATRVVHYSVVADTFGPAITVSSPVDGQVIVQNTGGTSLQFSCDDPSGVAECGPAFFGTTPVANGNVLPTSVAGFQTFTIHATDYRGNASTVTVTFNVQPAPGAAIVSPSQNASYHVGDPVLASYSCSAYGGAASCDGDVPSGSPLNTSAPGDYTFTVNVTDHFGNSNQVYVRYAVLAADVPPGSALPAAPSGGYLGPINIGSLGGSYAYASAVSPNGIVVGNAYVPGDTGFHGFVWTQAGGMKDLGLFDPRAVSNAGTVVGSQSRPGSNPTIQPRTAAQWTPGGGMKSLGALPFDIDGEPAQPTDVFGSSFATAVNARGTVAGAMVAWRVSFQMGPITFYQEIDRPAIWKTNGDTIVLPRRGSGAQVVGVTDADVLVGNDYDPDTGSQRAFVWTEAGGYVDIPGLGGTYMNATAVSPNGFVAGQATTADGNTHAFRWSQSTGTIDLGDTSYASPSAVNDDGHVTGDWTFDGLGYVGFSWTAATGAVPMPTLESGYGHAGFINASGQIAGDSYTFGYHEHHLVAWSVDGSLMDLGAADNVVGLSNNHLLIGNGSNSVLAWVLPGFAPDTTAPAVTIAAPLDGATLAQHAAVNASFSCSDAGGIASCEGTVANGSAIDTSVTGTFTFNVTAVDASGNVTTKAVLYTVSASSGGGSTPGHMHGDGWVANASDANERQRFAFDVLERPTGQHHLRFNFWTVDRDDTPKRTNVFDATSILEMHFSDDPGFTSGSGAHAPTVDTVTFSGTGVFNGQPGYTFEVTSTDKGEPGVGLDTFTLTVKDGSGAVVFSNGGPLAGGNIQSRRLPNRHFPPFLSGGPERVREIEATGPNGAVATFDLPTAVDEDGNALAVTCAPASGSMFALGRTRGVCTASDAAGRTGQMVFVIVVSDNTSPIFGAAPADLTVEATSPAGADVAFAAPAATDLVDTAVTVNCAPDSGRRFHLGATLVTCKARDNAGNTAVTTFTVTVRDTTAPAFAGAPANVSGEATSAAGRKVTFAKPAATDAADNNVAVTCAPASGATFPVGVTTVTCVATDNSGNTASTSFTVTVRDTSAPVIKLSKPVQSAEYKLGQTVIANYSCSDDVGVASCVGTVADGAAIDTASVGTKVFTVTATDAAGNTVTRTVTYVVKPR